MWGRICLASLSLVASVVFVLAVDSGAGAATFPGRPAGEAAQSDQQPSPAQLGRFLMRKGEAPGYRPVGRAQTLSRSALVKEDRLSRAEQRRLRDVGLISATFRQTRARRTAGVTTVDLFATAEGAQRDLVHWGSSSFIRKEVPRARITRFRVSGVPGAIGYKVRGKPGGEPFAHVIWVQGRCRLLLGAESTYPLSRPLSAGARAIYRRTKGRCP